MRLDPHVCVLILTTSGVSLEDDPATVGDHAGPKALTQPCVSSSRSVPLGRIVNRCAPVVGIPGGQSPAPKYILNTIREPSGNHDISRCSAPHGLARLDAGL